MKNVDMISIAATLTVVSLSPAQNSIAFGIIENGASNGSNSIQTIRGTLGQPGLGEAHSPMYALGGGFCGQASQLTTGIRGPRGR